MASPKPSQLFFSPAASLNMCLETAADSILCIYTVCLWVHFEATLLSLLYQTQGVNNLSSYFFLLCCRCCNKLDVRSCNNFPLWLPVFLLQFDATLDVLSSVIVLWRYSNAAAVHCAHREYMWVENITLSLINVWLMMSVQFMVWCRLWSLLHLHPRKRTYIRHCLYTVFIRISLSLSFFFG